jgi:hypothetical protein
MSSESVCQVARSWADVGSFHKRLAVRFMIFTASVQNILDTPSYVRNGRHKKGFKFFNEALCFDTFLNGHHQAEPV